MGRWSFRQRPRKIQDTWQVRGHAETVWGQACCAVGGLGPSTGLLTPLLRDSPAGGGAFLVIPPVTPHPSLKGPWLPQTREINALGSGLVVFHPASPQWLHWKPVHLGGNRFLAEERMHLQEKLVAPLS